MPSRMSNGEYRDVCFPCTKEFKQQFDQTVLGAYQQAMGQSFQQRQEQAQSTGPSMGMGMGV